MPALLLLAVTTALPRNSMMAESPFSDYTAQAVIYTIILGFLVTVLIGGGLLIVNIAMLSHRANDQQGRRSPGDLKILKSSNWPTGEPYRPVLPAELPEDQPPPPTGDEPAA